MKVKCIIIVFITTLFISSCNANQFASFNELDAIRYEQSNQANFGIVTENESSIFWVNHLDNASIYSYDKKTEQVTKIEGTSHAQKLHIVDDFLYFYSPFIDDVGFYSYRVHLVDGTVEQLFPFRGPVIRYPKDSEEPFLLHQYPEQKQYFFYPQTGNTQFILDNIAIGYSTYDENGNLWFSDEHNNNLYQINVLSDDIDKTLITDNSRETSVHHIQYFNGMLYYLRDGSVCSYDINNMNEKIIVPKAENLSERIIYQNLLVTDKYIFTTAFLYEEPFMRVIRMSLEGKNITSIYDSSEDLYGPRLIGIADQKIFICTGAYPEGNYQYTKVIDFEGNRLDGQFGLINTDIHS